MNVTYKRDDGLEVDVLEEELEFWMEAVYGRKRKREMMEDIREDAESTLEEELAWEHRVWEGRILVWGELEEKPEDYGRRE